MNRRNLFKFLGSLPVVGPAMLKAGMAAPVTGMIDFDAIMRMFNKLKSQPEPPESTEFDERLQTLAWMDTGDTTWQSLEDNGEHLLRYSIKFYGNTIRYPGLCVCMTVSDGIDMIDDHCIELIHRCYSPEWQLDGIIYPIQSPTVTVKHTGTITITPEV